MEAHDDEIPLPDLDDATRRLVEDRLKWELKLYAEECEPRIRRDFYEAAKAARRRGARPEHAAGKKTDMMDFQRNRNPPYLTRSEETWMKAIAPGSPEVDKMKSTAKDILKVAVIFIVLGIVFSWLVDYDVALDPTDIVIPAHIFFFAAGEKYIRYQAIRNMGPVAVPLVWPSVFGGAIVLYIGAWLILAYVYFPTSYLAPPIILCVGGGFLWMYSAYRRARARTKENYHEILRILGLPDV